MQIQANCMLLDGSKSLLFFLSTPVEPLPEYLLEELTKDCRD